MARLGVILVSFACLSSCSQDKTSFSEKSGFSEDIIREIASELAIQKGINLLCERHGPDHLSEFMDDLRYSGVSRDIREIVAKDSVLLMNKVLSEDPAFICTPEMFEGADQRSHDARLKWDEMRGISQ